MAKKKSTKKKSTKKQTPQTEDMTYFGVRYYITHKAVANSLILVLTLALITCLWWNIPPQQTISMGLGITAALGGVILLLPLLTLYFFRDRLINIILGSIMLVTVGLTAQWYRTNMEMDVLLFSGFAVAFTLIFTFTVQQFLTKRTHLATMKKNVFHPLLCPKDYSRMKFKESKMTKSGKVHVYECPLCDYRKKGFS
jgi:hypothetical protein